MQANQIFLQLWQGYLADSLTPDEARELLGLMRTPHLFTEEMVKQVLENPPAGNLSAETGDLIFRELIERIEERSRPVRMSLFSRRWAWPAAAAVVLLAGGLIWSIAGRNAGVTLQALEGTKAPDHHGAILTLESGAEVKLDSANSGLIAQQQGSAVTLSNGQLLYKTARTAEGKVSYNKLTTLRGKQFSVLLPDGTVAWLNAASSIRYPTVFTGKERTVEITGEVYMEVAANAAMPFVVKFPLKATGKTGLVQVLGTRFNINAYADAAAVKTTLVQGSVRVVLQKENAGNISGILRPGQQAVIANVKNQPSNTIGIRSDINIQETLAWKENVFNFRNMSLEEVMKELSRWYDLTVIYENGIPRIMFTGELERDLTLKQILEVLKASNVHLRLEKKRQLIITP
ncbi:FecR family protein [Chitinophaga polysaccharea]|uniref:FecR family protein n=1 Tax=Chitinophaga polysaccharea TaxID=1293035 RepID=UPI00115B1560|nr:FecR family protein [Chitinophaga polysaccharea]